MFKIPQILFKKIDDEKTQSVNTIIDYTIHQAYGKTVCYYGNGRHREFSSIDDAKDWIINTHYPAKVAQYFDKVEADITANDDFLSAFDGVAVAGGVDNANDDGCEGGACKL